MISLFHILCVIGILSSIVLYVNQFIYEAFTRKKIQLSLQKNGLEFKTIRNEIFHEVIFSLKEVRKRKIESDELNRALRIGIWHIIVQILVGITWIGIVAWWILALNNGW
jgi:hypothetical protein